LSWQSRPVAMSAPYGDEAELARAVGRLRALPPLITSGEVESLRQAIAEAQEGKRFLLQGGDCAEALSDCTDTIITSKIKILLQMSLVLVFAAKKPVIRVGRIAGQYAKPRSSATETRDGVSLPSYFGDLINRPEFSAASRAPDPELLVQGYKHAGLTLNFIRSLLAGGLADLHHPERWNLDFLKAAQLAESTRERYTQLLNRLLDAVRFMEAAGERNFEAFSGVSFFTSHEALSLHYESSQTRRVPRKDGWWNLTTHLPWIGERTRQLDGAHVEYCRGIENPVGVKLGPTTSGETLVDIAKVLNPSNAAGKLVLIPRMGVGKVRASLPGLVEAAERAKLKVLWVCDPMHGNGRTTASGLKTRHFGDITEELAAASEILESREARLGGAHIELTGEDVTECLGGVNNISETDLHRNYATQCDPRLNYEQAMEIAFLLADLIKGK
jgi:3-deoxy-7-phosphoheptulonate synthase